MGLFLYSFVHIQYLHLLKMVPRIVFLLFVLCCYCYGCAATETNNIVRRSSDGAPLRRLFLKFAKRLFFIPGPFEPDDVVTPFDVITNQTAEAVNSTSTLFWDPFFQNVISRKIDDRIESVESKTEVLEAKENLTIALARIPFGAIWGPETFDRTPPPESFELGVP
eukprot:Selendium_serpulae@DN5711_c0_g1_i1.p1